MTDQPQQDFEQLCDLLRKWASIGDFGRGADPTDLRRIAATLIEQQAATISELRGQVEGKS